MVRQADDRVGLQRTQCGVVHRRSRLFVDNAEDVGQHVAERVRLPPASQRFRNRVHESHAAVDIGRDDSVANARQRRAEPLRLLAQGLLGTASRDENAVGVVEGDGAKSCLFVVVGCHY